MFVSNDYMTSYDWSLNICNILEIVQRVEDVWYSIQASGGDQVPVMSSVSGVALEMVCHAPQPPTHHHHTSLLGIASTWGASLGHKFKRNP